MKRGRPRRDLDRLRAEVIEKLERDPFLSASMCARLLAARKRTVLDIYNTLDRAEKRFPKLRGGRD